MGEQEREREGEGRGRGKAKCFAFWGHNGVWGYCGGGGGGGAVELLALRLPRPYCIAQRLRPGRFE